MEKKWTPDQRAAIDARGVSLAVSAAAGSGKTAVLTERILSLLSEEGGLRASRLAVVTFTRAAARELEGRLYEAISKKVAAERENRHLNRQLFELSRAQISTIHSFAYTLIKEYHRELGLGEALRILPPAEAEELSRRAAKEAVRAFLEEAERDEKKELLFRLFGKGRRASGLEETLIRIHREAAGRPGGLQEMREKNLLSGEMLKKAQDGVLSFYDTPAGAELLRHVRETLEGADSLLLTLAEELKDKSGEAAMAYAPFLKEKEKAVSLALSALQKPDPAAAAGLLRGAFVGSRVPSLPKKYSDPDVKETCHGAWNRYAKDPIVTGILPILEEDAAALSDWEEGCELLELLFALCCDFEERFRFAKREKGAVDYNDLEHLALQLVMTKKDGAWEKTPLAHEIGLRYDAVFVDEYQDTNEVQDMLFRAIAGEDKLFVVGDPKQSIYRFRGAEPRIFAAYKNDLPRYPDPQGGMQKIFLSNNFRCNKSVIDLVNRMFRAIMDERAPSSLYKKEDQLVFSKVTRPGEEEDEYPAELCLVEEGALPEEVEYPEEVAEASWIAGRITALMREEKRAGVRFEPKDVAVICRSHRQISRVKTALDNRGIPCTASEKDAVKKEEEYLFVTSLLAAVENPTRDVPLLAVLASPVFRFSPDSLYRIRRGARGVPFYTALCRFAEAGDHDQTRAMCRDFLALLDQLRDRSRSLTLSAFLFYVYEKWGLDAIYAKNGKKSGIRALLTEAAGAAQEAGVAFLGAFCRYLQDSELTSPDGGEGVRLLTMHKSKGLEFPVVFVSFLSSSFSQQDEIATLLLSDQAGCALSLPSDGGRIKRNNQAKRGVKALLHRDMIEEEKRILYVAATRARQRLFLTGSVKDAAALKGLLITGVSTPLPVPLSRYLFASASSPLQTVLLSLRSSPALEAVLDGAREAVDGDLILRRVAPESGLRFEAETLAKAETAAPVPEVMEAVRFVYPERDETRLPKKLSVSQILRQKREEEAPEFFPRHLFDFENGRLKSGAEAIGTATHKVMQFADLDAMAKDPEAEFARLVERGFLSEEEMALVEKEKVLAFFDSELYAQMAASDSVVHEKRWAVLLPASLAGGKGNGEVLVQGVVDAWFENPDGSVTVVDFKTDRVKADDGEAVLRERHGDQLRLYGHAVARLTGKPVSRLTLYSFALGRAVDV
ncbi:MAG: UvrD-helicase domain-containing protein [Clostridia bacterium]|nr:UvrD-helicase domain-containing protein [Clostridia bacterium]